MKLTSQTAHVEVVIEGGSQILLEDAVDLIGTKAGGDEGVLAVVVLGQRRLDVLHQGLVLLRSREGLLDAVDHLLDGSALDALEDGRGGNAGGNAGGSAGAEGEADDLLGFVDGLDDLGGLASLPPSYGRGGDDDNSKKIVGAGIAAGIAAGNIAAKAFRTFGSSATTSTAGPDITKDEVRALFSLWNNALATGDSRIVAKRYAKNPVLLPTVSDTPRTDYSTIKDYFDGFLLKQPQGTILDGNILIGDGWAQDMGIYEVRIPPYADES